jgi:hypothetical protein
MGWFDQQAQQMPPQGGSLAALGGGTGRGAPIYNPAGPQPVPGMPPRPMRDLMPDPTAPQQPFRTFQDVIDGGNRGSGQPINQPMGPPGSQGGPLPADAGPMPQFGPYGGGYDQNTHQWVSNTQPVGIAPTGGTGSLQSLGGGQLNQSGMVNLRGPDGSTKAVSQNDLAHWLSKGAVRV